MQDNSTNDIIEMLTRYMDGELTTEEKITMEELLKKDVTLQERYQHLLAARRAIRMQGLKQHVQAIQKEYLQEMHSEKPTGKNISVFRTFMSVAAVLIIIVAGYGLFQYISTTNESVYSSNFINYNAPVSRGNIPANGMVDLYSSGKYAEVVRYFESLPNKSQQDYFIVAQAYLHLNNSKAAINNFKQVQNLNNNSTGKYFVQETDYFLLLAYIKSGDIDEAEKKLDKIISDKQHLFYKKAKSISRTKLIILKWKDED